MTDSGRADGSPLISLNRERTLVTPSPIYRLQDLGPVGGKVVVGAEHVADHHH